MARADASAGRDPRVAAYIAQAAPFARPVLEHLRATVHAACPATTETIKWGMPFFMLEGRLLAHMAAFKRHCAFGFWQGRGSAEPEQAREAMGQFGRIAALSDLPSAVALKALVVRAAAAGGGAKPRAPKAAAGKPPPVAPADLVEALARNAAARRTFEGFPPGKQRDYVEWITQAKREATRARRLVQAVEWLAEGKARHWKYEAC